jgi:Family of unknown function (DUF6256)
MDAVRVIVPPLVTAYAIFVVMVVRAWRGPKESPPRRPALREIVWTVAGGYLVFLVIVALFHVGLAGQHGALRSAATGGAFLLASASVVYAVLLWNLHR